MPYRLTITRRNNEVREIEYESRKLAVEHFQKSSYGQNVICVVLEKFDGLWTRIARMDLTENSGGEGFVGVAHPPGNATVEWPRMRQFDDANSEEIPF